MNVTLVWHLLVSACLVPLLQQIQKRITEHAMHVPIYELAFIWAVAPRVAVSGANIIPGFAYSAPFEDLKLKP